MKLIAIGAFALATLAAGAASAQAQQQVTHGAPIPGLCTYSLQRALGQSTAGQSLRSGLQRLAQEVQGELQPYATSLESEAQQLQSAGPIDPNNQAYQAWQGRLQQFQQLQQTREAELRYTDAMQTQAIGAAAGPIITALYQERGCSILLNESVVLLGNPAMDLTDTVVQRLNQALPTLPAFNRMQVPPQQQQ
ncbi:OmpH family outer membrane protein [Brevundimonas lenta]|uniref:Outer membrane protein n=1 Tax=Brevundimonas lenta TaxID=424796 RepID=A0A7W6JES5_9CAUL|nr:OmpH family outer membrane protein [Brevundimonas lenta]MBB4082797.1 outer membrane protein [Brevundimonas lenta]